MEHRSARVFAARSLLTPFNVVLNSYPCTSNNLDMRPLLEENMKAAEEIGLDVRAVVRERNSPSKRSSEEITVLVKRLKIVQEECWAEGAEDEFLP